MIATWKKLALASSTGTGLSCQVVSHNGLAELKDSER